jgi:Glycosyltransferase
MRIAYVSTDPGIPVFGCKGASIHVQEMLRAFLGFGAEVTLIAPEPADPAPEGLGSVRLRPFPPAPKGDAEARATVLLNMNADVAAALSAEGPFDFVYERHALFAHAAMEWAAATGVPGALEVNAPLIEEQIRHRSLARLPEAQAVTRRAMISADQVLAVSNAVADYARGFGARSPHVVPNAVNPARFAEPAQFEGPFTVGFLGTLKPWHDVATLVDAMALLVRLEPQARLLIVGDGPEREALTHQVAEFGLSGCTEFTGALPAKSVPEQLRRMHVGTAPYRGSDPFYFSPLKLYEYMAAGLPVVASRVGTLDTVVAEARTGRLVPPDDPEALARTLANLAQSPQALRKMGATARHDVLAHHTWDRVAERVLSRAGLTFDGAA